MNSDINKRSIISEIDQIIYAYRKGQSEFIIISEVSNSQPETKAGFCLLIDVHN